MNLELPSLELMTQCSRFEWKTFGASVYILFLSFDKRILVLKFNSNFREREREKNSILYAYVQNSSN